jgi:RimJ/RimL family protein N-acetyltransferase
MIDKNRYWMKIRTAIQDVPELENFISEKIESSHVPELAKLMDASYKNTIDYEGETPEQCVQEMKDTIAGKYGPFIYSASFILKNKDKAVSAILLTEWKSQPLIAYTMSDPDFQGKGLAKNLIRKSISALAKLNRKELFLVVTDGNTSAQNLYKSLGFEEKGLALAGTPPPAED